MAPDIVYSPLGVGTRVMAEGRVLGVVPGVVRCGRYMKLMSCNNKPKYMTKQRPEEKQQQQQQKKRNRKKQRTTRSSLSKGYRERERKRREEGREGGRADSGSSPSTWSEVKRMLREKSVCKGCPRRLASGVCLTACKGEVSQGREGEGEGDRA